MASCLNELRIQVQRLAGHRECLERTLEFVVLRLFVTAERLGRPLPLASPPKPLPDLVVSSGCSSRTWDQEGPGRGVTREGPAQPSASRAGRGRQCATAACTQLS